MDVKAMDFPEASFDTVVDKATIDSVLVKFGLFSVEKIQLLMLIKWFRRSIECWVKMEFMWQFPMDSRNSVWRTLRSHNTSGVWKCSKSLSQRLMIGYVISKITVTLIIIILVRNLLARALLLLVSLLLRILVYLHLSLLVLISDFVLFGVFFSWISSGEDSFFSLRL